MERMAPMNRCVFAALVVALGLGLPAGPWAQSRAADEHWVATWGTAQQLFRAPAAGRGQPPAGPSGAAPAAPGALQPTPAAPIAPPAATASTQGRGGPQR